MIEIPYFQQIVDLVKTYYIDPMGYEDLWTL